MSGILGTQSMIQLAVVVHNIDEASQQYADFFGVPKPDYMVTQVDPEHTVYKGQPSKATAKLAFFQMGNIQLELIEPDQEPSVWRDYLDEHGEGFHHFAFRVDDIGSRLAELDRKGMPTLQKGQGYAYVDTFKTLKVMTELL